MTIGKQNHKNAEHKKINKSLQWLEAIDAEQKKSKKITMLLNFYLYLRLKRLIIQTLKQVTN